MRARDESGIAMITAIMASIVVLTLSVMAVQLSLHDSDYSGRDRDRISSVHAAEAGLDIVFSRLQSATEILPCTVSGKTTATPSALYRATIQYFLGDTAPTGAPLTCLATGPATPPKWAVITSTSTTGKVQRTMQAQVRLTPTYGQFNKAIFSDASPQLDNNIDIKSADGNADFYTNGNFVCPTNTGGGLNLSGNLYAQGYMDMKTPCGVAQTAWVAGKATLRSGTIGGDLVVGAPPSPSLVDLKGGSVGGSIIAESCPLCPGAQFVGQTVSPPKAYAYPPLDFRASDWTGYTYQEPTSCAAARTALKNLDSATAPAKNLIFVSAAACPTGLVIDKQDKLKIRGDLALVLTTSMTMESGSYLKSADTQRHTLHVIIPSHLDGSPLLCVSGKPDIDIRNNPDFDYLDIFFYVPDGCELHFAASNATVAGQLYAGVFDSSQKVEINYKAVFVPGVPNNVLTGYSSEIVYVREVKPSST